MKKLILLILILNAGLAKAQYIINYKKIADTYFEQKDYYAAATFYKKALKINSDTANASMPYSQGKTKSQSEKNLMDYEESIYNLAEASRLYRDFSDAQKYYELACAFTSSKYDKACFYYGQSLRANQNFTKAINFFELYLKKKPADSMVKKTNIEIQSCKFAIAQMRYPNLIQFTRIAKDVNNLGSNYAATLSGDKFYFTSSRPIDVKGKSKVMLTEKGETNVLTPSTPYINALYIADEKPTDKNIGVKKLELDLPKDVQIAAATFSADGNKIYFTVWEPNGKHAIYKADKSGDKWINAASIGSQINSIEYNSLQPFITADGKQMYFASDRPGGFGKNDIWVSNIREDGSFSTPVNLGPKINSENDERAPYYNIYTKSLIFSGDGRVGLGGLDFFEATGDLGNWSNPVNMGYPFNSSKDDAYFFPIDKMGAQGYISSDRESICCLEIFKIKREFITVSGKIIDCKTKKPLKDVNVSLRNSAGEQTTKTNEKGLYEFKVNSREPVKLVFDKEEYFIVSQNYTYDDLAKADTLLYKEHCISSFKKNVPIVLENIYFEFNKADLTEPSKLVLNKLVDILIDNPDIEIELGAHTDNIGTDEYNQELSERRAKSCVDYIITKDIAANRLTFKGYGESMPVAPNTTKKGKDNPEGRAKNRRTEFKVVKD
jgi:OOP family OmpA-OmpF porin